MYMDTYILMHPDFAFSFVSTLCVLFYQHCQSLFCSFIGMDHSIVNMVDSSGNTSLHEACIHGNAAIVKVLLEHNANMKTWNCQNETPLHTACKEGLVGIVETIVDHDQSTKDLLDQILKDRPFTILSEPNKKVQSSYSFQSKHLGMCKSHTLKC